MTSTLQPPGPKGLPLIGVLPRIWRNPLTFFQSVAAEFGGIAKFGNRKFTLYLLSDPDAIEHVLIGNAKNYWKGEGLAAARTVMGRGLATSHGTIWKRQRKLMQPAFRSAPVRAMTPLIEQAVDEVLERWDHEVVASRQGECRREILPDASGLVQTVLFRGLFGADVERIDTAAMSQALADANDAIYRSAWSLIKLPERVPTPARRRFANAMRALDAIVYGLIRERRNRRCEATAPDDLLGRLVAARDPESGEGMSDEQIRDEVMTTFVAGHDTTTAAIAWSWAVLGTDPSAAQTLRTELDLLDGELPELTTGTSAVARFVREILRLYPPGWVVVRTPLAEDQICGYTVPKDAPLLISPWVVHRSADLWPDPTRFDPGRFLVEQNRPRFAYLPYGGGARICIGNHLADLIIATTVARTVARFDLNTDRMPEPVPRITLQPKAGATTTVRRRPQPSSGR